MLSDNHNSLIRLGIIIRKNVILPLTVIILTYCGSVGRYTYDGHEQISISVVRCTEVLVPLTTRPDWPGGQSTTFTLRKVQNIRCTSLIYLHTRSKFQKQRDTMTSLHLLRPSAEKKALGVALNLLPYICWKDRASVGDSDAGGDSYQTLQYWMNRRDAQRDPPLHCPATAVLGELC